MLGYRSYLRTRGLQYVHNFPVTESLSCDSLPVSHSHSTLQFPDLSEKGDTEGSRVDSLWSSETFRQPIINNLQLLCNPTLSFITTTTAGCNQCDHTHCWIIIYTVFLMLWLETFTLKVRLPLGIYNNPGLQYMYIHELTS